jgi:beta-glucanase (GH16 family)
MQHKIFSLALLIALVFSCSVQKDFQGAIHEDFNKPDPKHFGFHTGGLGADFTRAFGIESPSEPGTNIMLFRIDPEDRAGAGRGPEIISNDFTHFGTYAARLKVPDVKNIQPDVGAVVGYFTYHMDSLQGLSEIDVEWLIADPTVIYVGTWTGPRGNLKRIGRSLNLAEGKIYSTTYREGHEGERSALTGEQNVPETIPVIEGYDASAQFYTYGFDWHPDRIRWWMIHPVRADTVVLWDYSGSLRGIPQHASRYRLNFWHTNNWSVETNPNSIEKPHQPYELEVDWMSYTPLKATE